MTALAAAQEAARYRYGFFWHMAAPMLYLSTPPLVEKVVVQHRDDAAVDDVVVYYSEPGIGDAERRVRTDYYQVKFHGGQARCIEHTDFLDPSWTGMRRSLLWRFAESWKELRERESRLRMGLVTDWQWCPNDPLTPLIRECGMLDDPFFMMGSKSEVGKAGMAWREHLTLLDDAEFREFIRQLRLWDCAVSLKDADERLAERCLLAGLRAPNPALNDNPYDKLAGRLLADGRGEFTPARLSEAVKHENLLAEATPPFQSSCAIRSLRANACVPETSARLIIDLADMFTGRDPIDSAAWSRTVPSRLHAAAREIHALPRPVHLALDTHLSVGWFVGTILGAKAPMLLRQKGDGGVVVWDSSIAQAEAGQKWQLSVERVGDGADLAVAISVNQDVTVDVRRTLEALTPSVGTLVDARLPALGGGAIRSGRHACALADELTSVLRLLAHAREVSRTRVFAACPVNLAFLIGQRSVAIGPMTFYEMDFGRTRMYQPALAT